MLSWRKGEGVGKLTVCPSVVGLDVRGLDLAVLDDEGVALRARVAEDGDHVEAQI